MHVRDVFRKLDERKLDVWQSRALFTIGMGSFTDGYDLVSISVVLTYVTTTLNASSNLWKSLFTGSALAGSIVGALIFGVLASRGRKRFYGVDVAILALGALAQAFARTPVQLALIRGILGIGVGADYVLSPLIMAEHSNSRDRGKLLALGFGGMWTLGSTASAALTLVLQSFHLNPDLIWRVVLGLGALPAASVIYLRRKVPETPRYLARIRGNQRELSRVIQQLTGYSPSSIPELKDPTPPSTYFQRLRWTFLTACTLWFLFNLVNYSSLLFGPNLIAKSIGIGNGALFQLMINLAFTLPALGVAVVLVDRIGRRPIQIAGFVGAAISLLSFALLRSSLPIVWEFTLYGLFNFFTQVGPGSTNATWGTELSPTRVRSAVMSYTVVSGRSGAVITSFVFPYLFSSNQGLTNASLVLALISGAAALLTLVAMPEARGKPLEDSSRESLLEREEFNPSSQ